MFRQLYAITLSLLLAGCANTLPLPPSGAAAVDYKDAATAYERIESRATALVAIDLLESYATQNPGHYGSRARLANAWTLYGAGYARSSAEKESAYAQAMKYGEAAMRTHAGFAAARDRGESLAAAVQYLGMDHLEAMEFWKTALFYNFRETTNPVSKVLRYKNLRQAVAVMERMEEIDRNAIWGSNLFSQGIYYLAQPEFAGGDRAKSAELLAESASISDRNILPRWGRAKYYAVAMQDFDLFRSDLEWVAAQPQNKLVGYRPWNRLLLHEARAMLDNPPAVFRNP